MVGSLEEGHGKPATVVAACINNVTKIPRLGNNDYMGSSNFLEQLEAAAKPLKGAYEAKVNTINSLR